jgi:hypothetical protein
MKALDQLYFVNPHLGPKDEVLFDKVDPDYTDFLTKMSGLFGKAGTKPTSLDTMMAADPKCATAAAKHYLQIQDPKAIQKIMGTVQQLFNKQLNHTKQVLNFFKQKLFMIRKTRDPGSGLVGDYVEIHPKLLQGGIQYLSVVSKEARELLVGYYSGCEELYQKGVQDVLTSKHIVI